MEKFRGNKRGSSWWIWIVPVLILIILLLFFGIRSFSVGEEKTSPQETESVFDNTSKDIPSEISSSEAEINEPSGEQNSSKNLINQIMDYGTYNFDDDSDYDTSIEWIVIQQDFDGGT